MAQFLPEPTDSGDLQPKNMKNTVKEKLEKEQPDENIIRLYKEGLFYEAYNFSAIRFKELKPRTKLLRIDLKNGEQYFKIGVPCSSLAEMNTENTDGDVLEMRAEILPEEKRNLQNIIPDVVCSRAHPSNKKDLAHIEEQEIIQSINALNMAETTPMEALQLINKWKQKIKK